ncbi:MAG: four helix bundle protein [Phycisphaeraceae bacterium]
MGEIRTFRDLIAWQRAMTLVRNIYGWTRDMPVDERFGLTNQIRRAAVSIPSNIAEGYARGTTADYVRFLRIARGSLAEVCTQTDLIVEFNMLTPNEQLTMDPAECDRVLQGLLRSLEQKLNS